MLVTMVEDENGESVSLRRKGDHVFIELNVDDSVTTFEFLPEEWEEFQTAVART